MVGLGLGLKEPHNPIRYASPLLHTALNELTCYRYIFATSLHTATAYTQSRYCTCRTSLVLPPLKHMPHVTCCHQMVPAPPPAAATTLPANTHTPAKTHASHGLQHLHQQVRPRVQRPLPQHHTQGALQQPGDSHLDGAGLRGGGVRQGYA